MDLTSVPKLWIPGPLPGLNEILNAKGNRFKRGYSAYTVLKKKWCDSIMDSVRASNFPHYDRGHVSLFIFEPHLRRDFDNVQSGASKMVLDGLVASDVLPNDGRKFVLSVSGWVLVDKTNPGAYVTITDRRVTPDAADHFILTLLKERLNA
jgi:hypothetical protein